MPRQNQGSGRHDNPALYGAFYCSLDPLSCIAEALQPFRGRTVTERHLSRFEDRILALAGFELSDRTSLVDLDDPRELEARGTRPSIVATTDRKRTQSLAARIFNEGAAGFLWWSTLESLWVNCTLFEERIAPRLRLSGEPRALSLEEPAVVAAAAQIGILLAV